MTPMFARLLQAPEKVDVSRSVIDIQVLSAGSLAAAKNGISFEVSQIEQQINDVRAAVDKGAFLAPETTALPFPITLIETRAQCNVLRATPSRGETSWEVELHMNTTEQLNDPIPVIVGFIVGLFGDEDATSFATLEKGPPWSDAGVIQVTEYQTEEGAQFQLTPLGTLPIGVRVDKYEGQFSTIVNELDRPRGQEEANSRSMATWIYGALSLINMPRGFVHERAGSSRQVRRAWERKHRGDWPYRDGVTIRLPVSERSNATAQAGDETPGGGKMLHRVRRHQRVLSTGYVTSVRAHWRGKAELGIKMSDYELTD